MTITSSSYNQDWYWFTALTVSVDAFSTDVRHRADQFLSPRERLVVWVRIEDTFYDHPKIIAAGNAAVGLHVRGLSYACHHMTDGKIPRRFVQGCLKTAERLVLFGLWDRDGEDYIIHDYLKYNLSAKDVQARRAGDRVRKESYRNPNGVHEPVQTDSERRLDIDKTKTRLERERPPILDAPEITPEQAALNRQQFSGMVAEVAEKVKAP